MVADPAPGSPSIRWASIGTDGRRLLTGVELWTVELPFLSPVRTAKGVVDRRPLVLVRLSATEGGADVSGWGECAALADTTFDGEDADAARASLADRLVPALLRRVAESGGVVPPPPELEAVRDVAPDAPLGFAALEMAVADLHLRAEGRSLAQLLGVEGVRVELGAVAGRADSIASLVTGVEKLSADGYRRVKLKVGPGWDLDPIAAVAEAVPHVRLQADANGVYGPVDIDHLVGLDRFGLLCLEQPFPRADLASHAELAARMRTPICLDEGVDSPAAVDQALALGACSVVCIKPSRLGGIGRALEVIDRCSGDGIPLWMGGMFESGYGRGVNTTLAALDGFAWPGDLSPARSYLADDLVPTPPLTGGVGGGTRAASPPIGPGMGPRPQSAALRRLGARVTTMRPDGL